jgi:hypothetical protein
MITKWLEKSKGFNGMRREEYTRRRPSSFRLRYWSYAARTWRGKEDSRLRPFDGFERLTAGRLRATASQGIQETGDRMDSGSWILDTGKTGTPHRKHERTRSRRAEVSNVSERLEYRRREIPGFAKATARQESQ